MLDLSGGGQESLVPGPGGRVSPDQISLAQIKLKKEECQHGVQSQQRQGETGLLGGLKGSWGPGCPSYEGEFGAT